jgi:hypothetical protein
MKDCRDCLHREWSNHAKAFVCKNAVIAEKHGYFPRWNVERADGFCGPDAKYYKDKRDI